MAKEKGIEVMLTGSGAEELFVGYHRYYSIYEEGKELDKILQEEFRGLPKGDTGMINKVVRKAGLEPRHPFINKKLADFIFSIPLEKRMEDKELKKGLLREAAKLIGVPETVLKRRKRAAQYGSGVHRIIMKHSKKLNEEYPPQL